MDVVPFDSKSHVGLLGCDFLASANIGIDMKHQKVTVTAPDAFDPKALGLAAVPAQLDDCVPEVPATFDGVAGTFIFDTGAGVTVLDKPFADKIGSKKPVNPDDVQWSLGFIGGDVDANYYLIPNLIFGPIEFRNSYAMVPATRMADYATDDGVIGRDVLQAYVIYLDYSSGTVDLKPGD
jgi:hypothetical protein